MQAETTRLLHELIDNMLLAKLKLTRAGVEHDSYLIRSLDDCIGATEKARTAYRAQLIELSNPVD